jgi:serine/threonine-protein kinase RsbW
MGPAAVALQPKLTRLDAYLDMEGSLKWETHVLNHLPALMRAIEELDQSLERWEADANARYLAQLAIEELGTNIIKYGYDDREEHTIRLSAECAKSAFLISLEDDGHEFNPCETPEPDPNLELLERTPGGWGLSLVRRLLPGMKYERRGNHNLVCILVPRTITSATP